MLTGAERRRLAALHDGVLAPFLGDATAERIPAWEARFPRQDLLVLLSGKGRHEFWEVVRDVAAPALVFDPRAIWGLSPLVAGFVAETPCRVARIPLPSPTPLAIAERMTAAVEAAAQAVAARADELDDQVFSFLDADGQVRPGPYRMPAATLQVFPLEVDHLAAPERPGRRLRDLGLPPLLVLARFPRVEVGEDQLPGYEEAALFRACFGGGRPGVRAVWIRPESEQAELMGRALYGMRKRQARLDFEPNRSWFLTPENDVEIRWRGREERAIGNLGAELADALTPIPLGAGFLPSLSLFTRSVPIPTHIFSVLPGTSPRAPDQTVSSSFAVQGWAPTGHRLLHPTLVARRGSQLEGARVLAGFEMTLDFELGAVTRW